MLTITKKINVFINIIQFINRNVNYSILSMRKLHQIKHFYVLVNL